MASKQHETLLALGDKEMETVSAKVSTAAGFGFPDNANMIGGST